MKTIIIALFIGLLSLTYAVPKVKAENIQLPKLIDLGAHKCIPCKMMAPILDELTMEYNNSFSVEFIDVWMEENREIAQSYSIESIPTQIFFDEKGKELYRHVGFFSKEEILNKWKELGYSFTPSKKVKVGETTSEYPDEGSACCEH